MLVLAPGAVFVFDAIRVLVTLGSRSVSLRIVGALIVFVVALVSLPLVERADRAIVLALTGVVAGVRVAMQLLDPSPTFIGQMIAAAALLGLFGALVAANAVTYGGRTVGLGLLLGAAADIALLAALASLPLPWWRGWLPVVALLGVGAAMVGASSVESQLTMATRPPARVPAVAVAMIGAWVAFHVMAVANSGWVAVLSDGAAWLAVGAPALGVAAALIWETPGRSASQPVVAAVIALAATLLLGTASGAWGAVLVAVLAASSGVALIGALERDSSAPPERLQWATGSVPALAILPVVAREAQATWSLEPSQVIAGTGLVLLAVAGLSLRHNPGPSGTAPLAAVFALGAVVIGVGSALVGGPRLLEPPPAGELLVATFNLERGFSDDGLFDPEAAAQILIDLDADVVAIQEVARGRIRDGAADLVMYLQRRTGFTLEWVGSEHGEGAAAGLSVAPAGVADRTIDGVAKVIELTVGEEDRALRILAVDAVGPDAPAPDVGMALVDIWGVQPRTVLAGSFDSPPDVEPIATLLNAGMFDVTLAVPDSTPLTWPADLATVQLDYILISQDLRPAGARVVDQSSSSHLPVVSRVAIRDT